MVIPLLAAGLILSSPSIAHASESGKERLIFAGDEDFPPYSFLKGSSLSGFAVDLSRVISAVIKRPINHYPSSSREYIQALTKGDIDGLIGMPVIPELKKHFSYSIPVAQLDCAIFVQQTNEFVHGINSLEGTLVAIRKGSIYLDSMRTNNPKIKIMETDTLDEAFEKLRSGEITAVISEKNLALHYLHKREISGIKIVGPPISPAYYYALAVKRRDHKLLGDINRAIKILEDNGTIDNLKRKWFGISLVIPFPWKKVSIVIGVITGVMLVLLAGLWVTSLNAAIKIKTTHIQMLSKIMQEKDKLAVLGKLAGQIAHELRTPLSIMSNSVFLLRREGLQSKETFEKRLAMLEDKVRLTSNILESILSYSRVKAEVASTVSIKTCLDEVFKDIEFPPGIQKDLRVDDAEHLHVFMDFHQLYSIFRNLVTNSIQAMKNSGTLSVHAFFIREENSVGIRISDTGCGLSGITSDHIFDLFSSTKITGTGLGLPISKSIAETNGGNLYLESSSPSGTVFMVKLPVSGGSENKNEKQKKSET
ncbi:MAG: transporter substrate-binding domain-containing protein [Candidatus Omnitrophota bacterium]